MSVFDAEMAGDLGGIFEEAGHLADYEHRGVVTAPQIRVILDRDFEIYDENQVPMHVATISVMVTDVPHSQQGDEIVMPADNWLSARYWEIDDFWAQVPKQRRRVQQVLEDDGFIRRLWVS